MPNNLEEGFYNNILYLPWLVNLHDMFSSSLLYESLQMPRYQRTEFDEDRGSGSDLNNSTTTLDANVIFPPDITKGFANPNSDFDVVFKSSDGNIEHDLASSGSPIHPMVNIQRPTSKNGSSSGARSSLRFFKGKLLRPFGFDVFPSRGSSASSSSSSRSRSISFLWGRMTLLEKILFFVSVVLSVTVILLTLTLIQRTRQLIPYSLSPTTSSNISTKGIH